MGTYRLIARSHLLLVSIITHLFAACHFWMQVPVAVVAEIFAVITNEHAQLSTFITPHTVVPLIVLIHCGLTVLLFLFRQGS